MSSSTFCDVNLETSPKLQSQNTVNMHAICNHESMNDLIEIDDGTVFQTGERFESFDELMLRLNAHSEASFVQYWRRDSRTAVAARWKTARIVDPKIKYYSIHFACLYGGNKHKSKSKGQRNYMSMRRDCPSHVMLRADRSGQWLEVVSVCNHHNHAVSKELSRMTPRRLPPSLKEEVVDMLRLGMERRKIQMHIRAATGQILTTKHMINLSASVKKRQTNAPTPQRTARLQDILKKCESIDKNNAEVWNIKNIKEKQVKSSLLSLTQVAKRNLYKVKKNQKVKKTAPVKFEETEVAKMVTQTCGKVVMQQIINKVLEEKLETEELSNVTVDGEVQVDSEDSNGRNILEFFYPGEHEGEAVVTVLNEDHAEHIEFNHNHTNNSQLITSKKKYCIVNMNELQAINSMQNNLNDGNTNVDSNNESSLECMYPAITLYEVGDNFKQEEVGEQVDSIEQDVILVDSVEHNQVLADSCEQDAFFDSDHPAYTIYTENSIEKSKVNDKNAQFKQTYMQNANETIKFSKKQQNRVQKVVIPGDVTVTSNSNISKSEVLSFNHEGVLHTSEHTKVVNDHSIEQNEVQTQDTYEQNAVNTHYIVNTETNHELIQSHRTTDNREMYFETTVESGESTKNDKNVVTLEKIPVLYKLNSCANCNGVKAFLNNDVKKLIQEKNNLLAEIKSLKHQRDRILQDVIKIRKPVCNNIKEIKLVKYSPLQ